MPQPGATVAPTRSSAAAASTCSNGAAQSRYSSSCMAFRPAPTTGVCLLERETEHAVLAPDFLGFGLSEKPRDHTYTLHWQADLVEELVRRRSAGRPVFFVAHDMGTSVANELMARDLDGALRDGPDRGPAAQRVDDPGRRQPDSGTADPAQPGGPLCRASPASASSASSSARSSLPDIPSPMRRPRTSGP